MTEQHADGDADRDRAQGPDQQRDEHLEEALHQDAMRHPQDRACDETGDEEILKVGGTKRRRDGLEGRLGHQSVADERRGNEQAQYRRAADLLEDRNGLTELAEKEAKQHQDAKAADHVVRKLSRVDGDRTDERGE